jgi:NAD-dependent deacetylase
MSVDRIAALLRSVDRIAVLSGAGLSKASGIPTYRDAGGLWTKEGNLEISSVEGLRRDPAGFRAFWGDRRREIARARPNPGHLALVRLQQLKPETSLITQNVDGLLTQAGARDVLEIHGSLARMRCDACGAVRDVLADDAAEAAARCTSCGAMSFRPDVVMFGEYLDNRIGAEADFRSKMSQVFMLVGTSAVVYPAAGWAEKALNREAKLVVVNLEATAFDDRAVAVIRGRTEDVLPQIVGRMALEVPGSGASRA